MLGKSPSLVPLYRRNATPGDVIVAVNGRRLESLSSFVCELDRVGIDNTADLAALRGETERKVRVEAVDLAR